MGEAELLHVGEQGVRQLLVGEPALLPAPGIGSGRPTPRAQMDLVDRHGRPVQGGGLPPRHPRLVGPRERGGTDDPRRGLGPQLDAPGARVRLVGDRSTAGPDPVFVQSAGFDVGKEDLPHPAPPPRAERVQPRFPSVEVAHDADRRGPGSPHGEAGACHPFVLHEVGAHELVDPAGGGAEPVQYLVRPHGSEAVGVFQLHGPGGSGRAKGVGEGLALVRETGFEEAGVQRRHGLLAPLPRDPDLRGPGQKGANHPSAVSCGTGGVVAQHVEGCRTPAFDHELEVSQSVRHGTIIVLRAGSLPLRDGIPVAPRCPLRYFQSPRVEPGDRAPAPLRRGLDPCRSPGL